MRYLLELLQRFPIALLKLWATGFLLLVLGGSLNILVIRANDGMPVPINESGFFVIYPKYYRVAFVVTPDRMLIEGKAPGYVIMHNDTRLPLLAARFYFVSPINIWESIPAWLKIRFIRNDIPVIGQEMMASIGNIIVWTGDLFILIAATWTTLFVFFKGSSQKIQQRG